MSRSGGLAVPVVLLLLLLAATAAAALKPLDEAPQDDKPVDHLAHGMPLKEEPAAARIASAEPSSEPATRNASIEPSAEPAARIASAEASSEPAARTASVEPSLEPAARIASAEPLSEPASVRLAEKKDGGGDAAMPTGAKPTSGVAIQGGDPGTVPSAGSGNGNGNDSGSSASGEHGKEQSGGSSGKEAEKSAAAKSCLTKEECHKKRLLCGKGCTLSAHAKCAAKCSKWTKSCIPTC